MPKPRYILRLSRFGDSLSLSDCTKAIVCLADPGAGKSKSVKKTFLEFFARNGLGGVILCCKVDEAAEVRGWLEAWGRGDDVIDFSPGSGECFDFMSWQAGRFGTAAAFIENAVDCLSEIAEVLGAARSTGENSYWETAADEVIREGLKNLHKSSGRCDLVNLSRWVDSLPQNIEELRSDRLFSMQVLEGAKKNCPVGREHEIEDAEAFYYRWATMDQRPRSSVLNTVQTRLSVFVKQHAIRELFIGDGISTWTPEDSLRGKILLCNVSVKQFYAAGRGANVLIKRCMVEAIESRASPWPYCFLLMDEVQHFTTSREFLNTTTLRSSGGIWFGLTQAKSNFGAVIGGDATNHERVESLLGTCLTKIICRTTHADTCRWASTQFGSVLRRVKTYNFKGSPVTAIDAPWWIKLFSKGYSITEQWLPLVPESKFTSLAAGEAYMLAPEKKFRATGQRYIKVRFSDRIDGETSPSGSAATKDEVQIVKE